jgi:chemotaxis signal transduction protein
MRRDDTAVLDRPVSGGLISYQEDVFRAIESYRLTGAASTWVPFKANAERYIAPFLQIAGVFLPDSVITPMPRRSGAFIGLTSVTGDIYTVVDMDLAVGMSNVSAHAKEGESPSLFGEAGHMRNKWLMILASSIQEGVALLVTETMETVNEVSLRPVPISDGSPSFISACFEDEHGFLWKAIDLSAMLKQQTKD